MELEPCPSLPACTLKMLPQSFFPSFAGKSQGCLVHSSYLYLLKVTIILLGLVKCRNNKAAMKIQALLTHNVCTSGTKTNQTSPNMAAVPCALQATNVCSLVTLQVQPLVFYINQKRSKNHFIGPLILESERNEHEMGR